MSELPIESKKYGKFIVLYDEADAALVNKHKWSIRKDGGTFYVQTQTRDGNGKRKILLMHRLLIDAPPGAIVDHANHIGWCNTRANLRLCGHKENQQNRLKKSNTTSRYKGVSWQKARNKWQAGIRLNGKSRHIGRFSDESDAARAYDEAAIKYFGPYALLNFPDR